MIPEDDWLPLSAVQHYVFCPRQFALIHVEGEWEENVLTAKGRIEHERVDAGYREFRRGKRQITGVRVFSAILGLRGKIDVLELEELDAHGEDNLSDFGVKGSWKIYPVEFKHGEPKKSDCDRVQLCAQVICLEEMTGTAIISASLFYQKIRRREDVEITSELREKTMQACGQMHRLISEKKTPPPVPHAGCRSCSLNGLCMPKSMSKSETRYRRLLFKPVDLE